jgi:DNA-binding NarL/FixJ family response regulator
VRPVKQKSDAYLAVLVQPHILFREGLARILRDARFQILCSVSKYEEAVVEAASHENLLLIVGAGEDTVEQIRSFRKTYRAARATVVADTYRHGEVVSAFKAGANAYFTPATTCEAFIKSLELVMLGETLMPADVLQMVLNNANREAPASNAEPVVLLPSNRTVASRLSQQERRILNCLVDGDSNKVIARKIDIAEATVKVHVKAILRKIQVHNRTQAAIWAVQQASDSEVVEASEGALALTRAASGRGVTGDGTDRPVSRAE